MAGFDSTDDRLRGLMFEDGNRIRFVQPVDDTGRTWWLERFYDTHGLTPEDMGDAITRSVVTKKSIRYDFIDGVGKAFSLRVEGRFADAGEIWFVERTLNLSGSVFNADKMFIPEGDAGEGRGRKLMADLVGTCKLVGVSSIKLDARRIGRYAWLRIGFRPDLGSWKDLRRTLLAGIYSFEDSLGAGVVGELARRIANGREDTANFLAALENPVPSPSLFDADGRPRKVPLGKALFLDFGGDWSGEYIVGDPDTDRITKLYLGGESG